MPLLKFRVEHYEQSDHCRELVRRVIDLAAIHWEEMSWTNGRQFSPDIDMIANAWRDGGIKLITAYKDSSVVGYQLWTVSQSILEKSRMDSSLFSVFIESDFRGQGDFKPFLDFGVQAMRALGARRITIVCDSGSRMSATIERMGWKPALSTLEITNG